MKSLALLSLSFFFVSATLFAEGEANEVYLSGKSLTNAGDFVVTASEEVYHFQGNEYQVYDVYYDNPMHNMKIAVLEEGPCRSYIAYTDNYWFRYGCTKDGFGIRQALFNSAAVRDGFDAEEYHDQTVMLKKRRIERDEAVGLIAAYMPRLQG